jgi:molybdopterin/thiamine biosynthesis adenylyltransferase
VTQAQTGEQHALSTGEHVTLPPHDEFYAALTERNRPLISDHEQARLQRSLILVAGCGSVGGAVIEPLVRLGAENLILAEPDGYDMHNMNRQSVRLQDLGRNKALVFQERMRDINPFARIEVEADGITDENVQNVVSRAAVVVDAVDVTTKEPLKAKYALHVQAKRSRVPVVAGYDIAGVQLLLTYDYRDETVDVLHGKVTEGDIERLTPAQFLAEVIPLRAVPAEIIPVFEELSRGQRSVFPQLVYSAHLFGVLATRAVLILVAGRKVRSPVIIDVHDILRPLGPRVAVQRDRIRALIRLQLDVMRDRRARG